MANEPKNKPVKEFRFGAIKAAVWQREHEGKTFYSVSLSRSYKTEKIEGPDDTGWREVNSFDFTDLDTVDMALNMARKWIKNAIMETV
jgi:hypothetical protein